uniref:Uncharacterized protein n=1 Tax=Ciona intestinalis TaxID=7719 RepID=H2Y126_CIOIN
MCMLQQACWFVKRAQANCFGGLDCSKISEMVM